ncbi:MAG: alkaline phosphatase family protein [Myxococcales bacterium]|nr:alkaline phosphatase family protein [Myxococcales bacterium]
MMKRRDALKALGAAAGTAGMARFLPGCGDSARPPTRGPTFVVLMMENRSYDHMMGARAFEGLPGDGLRADMSNPDLDGKRVPVFAATRAALCDIDPPHGWTAAHNQWNSGANDGFLKTHQTRYGNLRTAIEPMQYQTRETAAVTWALADRYTSCDRYFSAVMGPTWPNRMYWHSGQSAGIQTNDLPTQGFNWPTIHHRLDEAGVSWATYFGNIPVAGFIQDLPGVSERIYNFGTFFDHAKAGTLPSVVYIDPSFYVNDDHPPIHPILGQELIASVYTALATSPQWPECTLVITYDEHGGFFDHVSPPKIADDFASRGFDQLGFRVPALVVGPYAKQGHVSSVVYNHASVLKHLQVLHQLAPLNTRVTASSDLEDCFDLTRLAKKQWRAPSPIPPVVIEDWPMTPACYPSASAPPQTVTGSASDARTSGQLDTRIEHPVLDWADARPELIARWDARGREAELLQTTRRHLAENTATLNDLLREWDLPTAP